MIILTRKWKHITIDKNQNKIYIIGRNKIRRVIDFSDIISIEKTEDSKMHIRRGKGTVLEGAIAGLYSGAGLIQGGRRRRGAEILKGAKYLTVIYIYTKKEKGTFELITSINRIHMMKLILCSING